MNEYMTWVVTCMDDRKLRLMLRWLPDEPWDWVDEMVIVTHRNRPDDLLRCQKVAEHWRPEWPIVCRTDEVEERELANIEAPYPLEMFFQHSLGVKILSALTHDAPMLFTDDDMVVQRDPSYLFDGRPFASYSGFDGFTNTPKDNLALDCLNETFDLNLTIQEFNAQRNDEAVWLMPTIDRDDYVDRLQRYFSHPFIEGVTYDKGTAPFGHTQRFRKIGMRFFSVYMIYRQAFQLRGNNYRILAQKELPQRVPKATFVHYCATGLKPQYMEFLWSHAPVEG